MLWMSKWSPINEQTNSASQPATCSFSIINSRGLHQKFKQTFTSAKFGGRVEATRRLLEQLPVPSQRLSIAVLTSISRCLAMIISGFQQLKK